MPRSKKEPLEDMIDTLVVLGSDWYWEQDSLFRYTRIASPEHPRWQEMEAYLGHFRWELPGAQALTMTWDEHRALLSARRPFQDFQYMLTRETGEILYLSVTGEPRFDTAGGFIGYRGTSRNISKEWAERARLQDAQTLLGVATVLGRFGAWSVDIGTGKVRWTEQARTVHGLLLSQATTQEQSLAMYAPESRELLRACYQRCVSDGTPYDVEVQALTASQERVWVRVIGVAERDAKGRIVRVQGAIQDIHQSKVAAEEHRNLAERFRVTLDSLTDGFATIARDWSITYGNPAAYAMLHLSPQQVLGHSLWEVFPKARDSEFEENYRAAMEHGEVRRFEAYYGPLRMWIRASAFPSEQGIAISFTDATAAVQARQLLLRHNEELEQRVHERTEQLKRINDELAAFTLAVAHDLRAPLAGISGFSRAAADRLSGQSDEKVTHYLGRIQAGAERMDDLLAGLLALSRIGRAEIELRPLDMTALARDAVEALHAATPERMVVVQVQDGLRAHGDVRLLRTLVENLVGNAWKFSTRREPARIEFGQEADGAFFVRDNGAGFDMERAQELFAPFRRLHDAGDYEGLGIGLASARRVVERHGGRIWAESAPDAGAVFRFTLPAAPRTAG
jgi:PAS domain S-box-containing protein